MKISLSFCIYKNKMQNPFFGIERIIFEKYINDLSSDTFKVLMKLLYIARTTDDNLKIRSDRALRRAIGINTVIADSIWNELVSYGLVIKKEKQDRNVYILNGKKIREDNNIYKDGKDPRNLKVVVFNLEESTVTDTLDDESCLTEIKRTLTDVDDELSNELLKLTQLLRKHDTDRGKQFRINDLRKLLASFVKYDNSILKETCYRYNNDGSIAGMRGYRYVLRIAESVDNDLKNPNKSRKFARDGYRIVGGVEIKKTTADAPDKLKQREEGELKFARKLALGRVDDNIIYRKLLQNNIKKLVELWNIGVKLLTDEGLQDKIRSNYSWLNL